MKRSEIIKTFLNSGHQLDLKALELLEKNPEEIQKVLEKIKSLKTLVITSDTLEDILKPLEIKILKDFSCEEKTYTVEDYTNFFNNRYEQIKKILIQRIDLTNLISINKISDRTKKFSLVTLVREKNPEERSIIAEDGTGELTIFFQDEHDFNTIVPDEIIGVVCEKQNEKVSVSKIIWPDVPLSEQIAKSTDDIYCLFISDFHMNSDRFNRKSYENFLNWTRNTNYNKFFIFVLGDISSDNSDIQNFLNDLKEYNKFFLKGEIDLQNIATNTCSLVEIQGVKIFVSHGDIFSDYVKMWNGSSPENVYLNLIKKRHLNPVFDFSKKIYDKDPYLVDTIPDIFVSGHFHVPGILNYKGITIISNGSFVTKPIFWLVNLKTRETFKLDFT